MKTIVLISSGQPSTNPRLVKEADLLSNSGYEVFVLYSFWIKWAYDSDFVLFKKVNWKPILVGGTPFNNKVLFFYTRIRYKLFSILAKWQVFDFNVIEITKGRAFVEMLKKTKYIKVDLYITYNLSVCQIAVKAAKFTMRNLDLISLIKSINRANCTKIVCDKFNIYFVARQFLTI